MTSVWQYLVQGLFVLLSGLTIVQYVRKPDRARLDILLMFAVVAIAILIPLFQKLIAVESKLVGILAAVFLLAHPYLIFRLASYYRKTSPIVRFSLLGVYVALAALLVLINPYPTAVVVLVAIYFFVGEVMAGTLFFRGAANSGGVTRWRLGLASTGSVLLGLLIGFAGWTALFAGSKAALQEITMGMSALVALSYYFAFASPRWLQRVWQNQELVRLMRELGEVPASTQIEQIGEYLSRAVFRVVPNSSAAGVGLPGESGNAAFSFAFLGSGRKTDNLRTVLLPNDGMVRQVWESGEPETGRIGVEMGRTMHALAVELGANSFYCVPISTRSHIWGILVVLAGQQSLFVEDDLNLLKIMARYASQVVDLRELVDSERELSEKLRRATIEAEASNRAKSDFLANMSHELRTPLNSIIGFSEILLEQSLGELNPKQQRYNDNILRSGRHLLQLINDILDLSKIEAGRMMMQLEEVEPPETIQEVLEVVASMAGQKEIELIAQIDEGLPTITADRAKFRQVLYNLLSNAIKFTLPNGTVTLTGRVISGPGRWRKSEELLEIKVIDTGIGIRPSDLDRVFGKFEQVDSSYARKQQGTGLGLALTKRLVEMHGGRISATSEGEGKGSTFTALVPVLGPATVAETIETAELPVPANPKPDNKGGAKVLVIEDDPQARELLTYHLEGAGFRVQCVSDGSQAVEVARRELPNAITLDILLPKSDGWEILKQLKSLDEIKNVPVIVVSITQDRDLGLSLGASEFLVKPIVGQELVDTVRAVTRSAKTSRKFMRR